jgi:hypothetical protein
VETRLVALLQKCALSGGVALLRDDFGNFFSMTEPRR